MAYGQIEGYFVIVESDPIRLQKSVESALGMGWQPLGGAVPGLAVTEINGLSRTETFFSQTVVKRKDKDDA